jgi:hypothetical protein
MTISWAGSELARQGFVAVGNTQGTTILNATSIQPGQLFPLLTKSGRMPENTIEIKWRPGAFDQTFSSFTTGVAPDANDLSRAGALSVFYSGLPAGGAGFLVKKTAVYEYIPSLSLKIASVPTSRNTSNNTLDHVINFLDSAGDWMTSMYNVGSRVNNLMNYAAPGARALGRAAGPLLLGM